MNTVAKTNQIPFRFVLSGIGAAVLLIATVLVGLYLGGQTQKRFQNIEKSWNEYSAQAAYRGELLSRIRAHLGYGGIIHNFKNYVLRKQPRYLEKLQLQFNDFEATVAKYRNSSASKIELQQLGIIETTIAKYRSKLAIAEKAAQENWAPSQTDKLVKVDDTQAIKAMATLDIYLSKRRLQATQTIARAVEEGNKLVKVGFFFAGVLAIVALILYGMFFLLQRELQNTIIKLSEELRERRTAELVAKKFQRAVDQSPATIIITDTKEKIEYVNQKFCELTGYSPDEVLGKTPKFLQSGDTSADIYGGLSNQLQSNETWHGTFRNMKKDGNSYWAKTTILPLRNDIGEITHYIGLGEDITENRKATEHIERAQKMEAVGLLASGVAHDFNNVLTTILGNVHLAQLDAPEEGEFSEELEQIEIAAKRARHLVGQVLAFARRQPGEATTVNIGSMMSEVTRLIRASIQPNIELEHKVESKTLSVYADPTRLHQILMNLCSNAAEAIGPDGGKITLTAYPVSGRKKQPMVGLKVADNGPGIPEAIQEDIFTPFFTTKRAGKGTGLGLSVVASHITEMEGEISLYSEVGKGTTFEITLPQIEPVTTVEQLKGKLIHGSGKILLIDDEPEVVETCANILRRIDYKVETFTDPHEAVRHFEQQPKEFDLVITDFVMPELSGEEVCIAIRKRRPNCPIVVYSAYQPGDMDLSSYAPIRYLEKPFEPATLASTVKSLLE
jgi:PAS domain S-box-containing protein